MTIGRLAAADGAVGGATRPGGISREVRTAVLALGGLAAVVALRWAAIVDGRLDGITIGVLFGLGLGIVGTTGAHLGGWRLSRAGSITPRAIRVDVIVGSVGGLALIGLALVARIPAAPGVPASIGLGPAAVFGPWLLATTIVALAEELILRGVLFSALDRIGGPWLAVGLTSAAFALMHVPVYGWHVVPLDLGVGIFLGGLRLATGRWLGPGIAHVVADVATWWL